MTRNLKKALGNDSIVWQVCIAALVLSMPWPIKVSAVVFIIILGISIAGLIVDWRARSVNRIFLLNGGLWPLYLFFVVHAIGVFYSTDTRSALSYIERIYPFVAMPIIVSFYNPVNVNKSTKQILLLFCCAVVSVSTLYLFLDKDLLNSWLTTNRTYIGLHLLFTCAVLLYYFWSAIQRKDRNEQILLGVALITSLYFVIQNGSKMSIFLVPVLALVFFIFYRKNGGHIVAISMAVVMLLLIVLFVSRNDVTRTRIEKLMVERTDYIRVRNYTTTLSLIRENLAFGVGTGDALNALQSKREDWWQEYIDEYNTHNQFLETMLRVGIPGGIIFISLFLGSINNSWKKRNFVYFFFILSFFISCMTEALLVRQKGVLYFAFFYCFFLKISSEYYKTEQQIQTVKNV